MSSSVGVVAKPPPIIEQRAMVTSVGDSARTANSVDSTGSDTSVVFCEYTLKIGQTLPLRGQSTVKALLGKGTYKKVYLVVTKDDQLLAVSCSNDQDVTKANKKIALLCERVKGISHALLPSLFQEVRIGSDRVFCQIAPSFDMDLLHLNNALCESFGRKEDNYYWVQVGNCPERKVRPLALEMVFIHNIEKVGLALLHPKNGVLAHLKKSKITHGDLEGRNLFVDIDEHGKIKTVVLADWDLHIMNTSLPYFDTNNSIKLLVDEMPSITKAFANATRTTFTANRKSIPKLYPLFLKGVQEAKSCARKTFQSPAL